jgi:hypothetical protein
MRLFFLYTILLLTLSGCTSKTNTGTTAPAPGGGERQARGDFSTPRTAVETFIAAAAAHDADLLSQCIADTAPGEFAKLRDQKAGKDDLDDLAQLMQGGEITDVKEDAPNNAAVVAVKLKEREERIRLTKALAGWKIVDF